MSTFTPKEKERIFVERTRDLWPQNWRMYLDLVGHETWSREQLDDYNFRRRKEMLAFAYENTEFYRNLYDSAGLKPEDIKTEEDWAKVPIVTKSMIAGHSSEFEVKDGSVEKFGFVANTGGSTGRPLKVYRDRRHFWQAPFWRFYGWYTGRKCGEPFSDVPVFGMDQAYLDRTQYRFTEQELKQKDISFWPIKYSYLSPYAEFERDVAKFMEDISKSPLIRLYAYAGAMDALADYCLENRIRVPNLSFVEVCASPVNQLIRDKVKEAFGCEVFDFYGSNEMGPMAVECCKSGPEHHLHVLSDLLHIDLVGDDRMPVKGNETGTTIVTCFTNKVFPFVRYDHGDRTHWIEEPCGCGLPFPCIAPVKGRSSEYLTTKSGAKVDGVGFNEVFDFYPEAVRQFQFRQKEDGRATLCIVPNRGYADYKAEVAAVFGKLQEDWKGLMEFSLEETDSIPHDGGKMRYIIHE